MDSLLHDLLGLVLPQECAGCGRADRALCRACLRRFGAPTRCEHLTSHLVPVGGPALPTWALAAYVGEVRHVVLAWKSGGRPDLAALLTERMARAAATVATELSPAGRVLVVPAPSAAARRRSGRFVVGDLADAVGRGLATRGGTQIGVVDVLRRRSSDGHLLSAAARSRDRAGAVRALATLPPGSVCVLVDDVVTTGATLAGCVRALASAGGETIGALALAATPPPGSSTLSEGWTHRNPAAWRAVGQGAAGEPAG